MNKPPDGFNYITDFLETGEQRMLMERLESLEYEHDRFRGKTLKRGYAQFGYAYVTSTRKLKPTVPMPSFLKSIAEKARSKCPEDTQFNQCIITLYPENAGISWHTDAPCFSDCIIALSLGATAKVRFRSNDTQKPSYKLEATSGSLYVMHGDARWKHQHMVVPVKEVRYSLTFRHVDKTAFEV